MAGPAPLTPDKIKYFASQQGFTGNDLNIAVAVALAESGGRPDAHNSTPPDDSYGLWQINMLGAMGPARRKAFGISTNEALYDPNVNAKAAYAIWRSSGWKAWTTYTRGTYKQHMDSATNAKPANNVGRTPEEEKAYLATIRDDATAVTLIPNSLNAAASTIFKAASNLTGIIVAVVLLVLGVVILLRNQIPVGKIAKKVIG